MTAPISPPGSGLPGSGFIPLSDGYGIQPLGPSPIGGDVHETLHIGDQGNVLDGHTTIRIPGGQSIHLSWK